LALRDDVVRAVTVVQMNRGVEIRIATEIPRFRFRHFSGADQKSVFVDLKPSDEADVRREPLNLELPPLSDVAAEIRDGLPEGAPAESDAAVLAAATELLRAGQYRAAIDLLEEFKANRLDSAYRSQVLYLLGEAYFAINPDNPTDQFMNITENLETALGLYPQSPLAPRARFILALAYYRSGFLGESIGMFRLVAQNHPDSFYARLADLFMASAYNELGKRKLAQEAIGRLLPYNPTGAEFTKKYYAMGQSYFQDGLFSQANEVFKEILDKNPDFYLNHPEILYRMGEGYYHADRMKLSRAFLYHALNIQPDAPNADQMMARLGDTYMSEDRDDEAIEIYDLTRRLYPGSAGALISEMRLADYGALRSLFPQDAIFMEIEKGVDETMATIYRAILETGEESPVFELAMFRLGMVYFDQGDYPRAVFTFKKLLEKYPKGQTGVDALEMIEKAAWAYVEELFLAKQYEALIAFYTANREYLREDQFPDIKEYLGVAYANLDMPDQSVELLEDGPAGDGGGSADKLWTLAMSYKRLGRTGDAIGALERFRERFPEDPRVADALVEQARLESLGGMNDAALTHLEEAMETRPEIENDIEIQSILADIYMDKGNLAAGVKALSKVLAHEAGSEQPAEDLYIDYSRLGQAYVELGQEEKAVAALDEALERLPEKSAPETVYLIATNFKELGLMDRHQQLLEDLTLYTNPFWRQVAEQELEGMRPNEEVDRLLGAGNQ
jgi:tetratricopeptide (TPR) repeat protein